MRILSNISKSKGNNELNEEGIEKPGRANR